MQWDAVVVAVRQGDNTQELRNEIQLLREMDLISTTELIYVEDACEDAGSAGSVLNALLITAERLTAKVGYSVLSEEVFHNNAVLLLLIGPSKGAFYAVTPVNKWKTDMDTIIVRQLKNLKKIEAEKWKGVWICGTDSCFSLTSPPSFSPSETSISVFSFLWQTEKLHGSYLLDSENNLVKIEYPSTFSSPSPIVLSLLFIPPIVSATILSLHSLYPLSASTYYGEDTGTLGLKLSIFFDFLLSTCLEKDVYLKSDVGEEKIHHNRDLRQDARSIIWEKMKGIKSVIVMLEASDYMYCDGNVPNAEQSKILWVDTMLTRLKETVTSPTKKIDVFASLVAIDRIYGGDIKDRVLGAILEVCLSSPSSSSRALYALSDFLYLLSNGHGGLRMGPAANPAFHDIFEKLREESDPFPLLEKLIKIIRFDWMDNDYKLVRGARHIEAAAQILYGKRTAALRPNIREIGMFKGIKVVKVSSAARVDIFGGWLDTPPITYETSPSAVINMAVKVDGQLPLSCELSLSTTPGISFSSEDRSVIFSSAEEVKITASRPSEPGALLCACFVSLGFLDDSTDLQKAIKNFYGSQGIHVKCSSSLPHGSGLGTSSILACCIVSALLGMIPKQKEDLVHLILYVEHLLTTGGGWQDQVGGIYQGIKCAEFDSKIFVRNIPILPIFQQEINRRLVLIYTGKTRLAKNLLQEVVRNWYAGGEVVQHMKSMQNELQHCESLLLSGIFPVDHVDLYYKVKKLLATGCEPPQVAKIIEKLKKEKIAQKVWLAGAGGGGFLYVWLEDKITIYDVKNCLKETDMTVHSIEFCDDPIIIKRL